jgi:hypothetical protein
VDRRRRQAGHYHRSRTLASSASPARHPT